MGSPGMGTLGRIFSSGKEPAFPRSLHGSAELSTPEQERLRGEVTVLLQQVSSGDTDAVENLMPLVYDELRRLARSFMRRERTDHTLQPTALVHEAYLRLLGQNESWQNRGHFFSIAATMMRRILVDSSRRQLRQKRGSGAEHGEFVEAEVMVPGGTMSAIDVLALHDALERLAGLDQRMVRIVELRFFAGLTTGEIAELLGVSEPTIKRSWSVARAWLARDLGGS